MAECALTGTTPAVRSRRCGHLGAALGAAQGRSSVGPEFVSLRRLPASAVCAASALSKKQEPLFDCVARLAMLVAASKQAPGGRTAAGEGQTPKESTKKGGPDGIFGMMPAGTDTLAEIKERSEFDDGGDGDEQWFAHVEH